MLLNLEMGPIFTITSMIKVDGVTMNDTFKLGCPVICDASSLTMFWKKI